MEYFIVQKKGEPYVEGGCWQMNVTVSSPETGILYQDVVIGYSKRDMDRIKKGDVYTSKQEKVLKKQGYERAQKESM